MSQIGVEMIFSILISSKGHSKLLVLNKLAPLKCKYIRANHSKFMTKELRKAIMLRTRFRYPFLKMKTTKAKAKYNKQRRIYVSLTRKAKRIYFESLNLNNMW